MAKNEKAVKKLTDDATNSNTSSVTNAENDSLKSSTNDGAPDWNKIASNLKKKKKNNRKKSTQDDTEENKLPKSSDAMNAITDKIENQDILKIIQDNDSRFVFIEHAKKNEDLLFLSKIIMTTLDNFFGLHKAKQKIHRLITLQIMNMKRFEKGLKQFNAPYNLVFIGNSGIGKTSVAQKMASLFLNSLHISSNKTILLTVSEMKGYRGATMIEDAYKETDNGVLIIDDIKNIHQDDYYFRWHYDEIIASLLHILSKQHSRSSIILTGTPGGISKLFQCYPTLRGYFPHMIEFEDFTTHDFYIAFSHLCDQFDYRLDQEAEKKLLQFFDRLSGIKLSQFSNYVGLKNLFHTIVQRQAERILYLSDVETNEMTLTTIEAIDIPDMI